MTEMAQTAADVPAETKRVEARPAGDVPSFSELVYAHYDWWRALRAEQGTTALEKHYNAVKHEFEAANGRIVKSYWCSHVESAVVLTEQKPRMSVRGLRCGFYLEGDWAAHDWPDIAAELHHCDELAVKATSVLTGVRHRICMNLIMASAEHLMSLVDRRASGTPPDKDDAVVRRERRCLEKTEHYYTVAANGQAQIVYFAGMALVLCVIAICASVWLSVAWATGVAALLAGASGAVVSVVQRINSGRFDLDYDVGRPYALFLGGLRPLIGGAFAMALAFAFDGGLLHLPVLETEARADRRLALLVIAFVAGFSERWAQDVLVSAVPGAKQKDPAPAPASGHLLDHPEVARE
jgi:hypothetical protein